MKRREFMRTILAGGGVALAGACVYAYQSSFVEVTRKRVFLPSLTKSARIVAVSDLHVPSIYFSLDELIKAADSEAPDIFILAGDTVDRRGYEEAVEAFKGVRAHLAKLAILGNWEYRAGLDLPRLEREYEEAGFSLLVNTAVEISQLVIVGLDDFLYGTPDYSLFQNLPKNRVPLLMLSHCPEAFDRVTAISGSPIIAISGHTHGGQIAPFGIVMLTPRGSGRYVQGWYRRERHSMYVMRGVGTSHIPLRMGARPEILVLDLVGT
jgi:hypothetical protein